MFKLIKELTRAPEPLSPRASPGTQHTATQGDPLPVPTSYTPRQSRKRGPEAVANGSSSHPGAAGSDGAAAVTVPELPETEDGAKNVAELLQELDKEEAVLHYLMTLSQLQSLPHDSHTLGAFRRHKGFDKLSHLLASGLAWKQLEGVDEEERQVQEVQRMEGVRAALQVLGWALVDRQNRQVFEDQGGYLSLLDAMRDLSPHDDHVRNPSSSTTSISHHTNPPNPQVLAHFLAHALNDNYTLLSLFNEAKVPMGPPAADIKDRLGNLILQRPAALSLLWSYVFGLEKPDQSILGKRKGKERSTDLDDDYVLSGEGEKAHQSIVKLFFEIVLASAQSSSANLFALRRHLPNLPEFLITRLFGYPIKRKFEVTFPAREDWYDDNGNFDDGDDDHLPWSEPSPELRKTYFSLLRKILEAGVDQSLTWRLFSLLKIVKKHGAETTSAVTSPPLEDVAGDETPTKRDKKRPKAPMLSINTQPPRIDEEKLDPEILELVRHAVKSRWPDVFVFRGGTGENDGGLEMKDLGRAWPVGPKGFNFSAWVYISKLNGPITLLDVSQSTQLHPLLRIRILENSQIAIYTSVFKPKPTKPASATTEEIPLVVEEPTADMVLDETICPAPDALVPHGSWVHFSVGCRHPKGAENGEVRIFINGVRVGAMRLPYPVPAPAAPVPNTLQAKPPLSKEAIRLVLGKEWKDEKPKEKTKETPAGRDEGNEWFLGRAVLMEEAVAEDIVLLLHHLGPRYAGNYQEALGKFLTYEGATSINIYLSSLAQSAADKRLFTSNSNSVLVKAIRQSPAFPEENLLVAISARDVAASDSRTCLNAAVPHPFRARQLRHGTLELVGNVESHAMTSLDESVSAVGGGVVLLKMIDLSQTKEELATTLGILRDTIKDSWKASEEMERIRGFELLAAILRPKMSQMVDTTCTKIILSMLGINMDKPNTATVHNSAAYRALALEFELWAHAPLGVVTLYLQHFEHLVQTSKHARYNVLRTFQKAAMVKKMLYALRSGLFDLAVVSVVVDTLRLAVLARWSGEDAIKPIFSFLVSSLCSSSGYLTLMSGPEPPPSQAPAAQILAMIADLSHQPARLMKLNKALALHRLLIIFISSNSAPYVIIPCLDILEHCITTPGLEGFQRSFEAEGGFALLTSTLGQVWGPKVQGPVVRMVLGDRLVDGKVVEVEKKDKKEKDTPLHCPPLVSTMLAALDFLLQSFGEDDSGGKSPTPSLRRIPTNGSTRSVLMTPMAAAETPVENTSGRSETKLQDLLKELTRLYRSSTAFRRTFTGRRVEQMLPSIVDFAAVSSSSSRPEVTKSTRGALADWLLALVDKSKLSHSQVNQLKLLVEQLRSPATSSFASTSFSRRPLSSSALGTSPAGSPRPSGSSSYFGSSFAGMTSSTPPASPSLGGYNKPIPRRRPSTDAGMSMMTSRPKSIHEMRMPLKRTVTGESILEGGKDKNAAWKLIIMSTDSQAFSKMTVERKEHWQRISELDWPRLASTLRAENGLWPDEAEGPVAWRLDGSEGPFRMRNRLERVTATNDSQHGGPRTRSKLRDAIPSMDELSSAVSRVNMAPWEDPFALALGDAAPIAEEESPLAPTASSGPSDRPPSPSADSRAEDESFVDVEEGKDDKMRRIAKTLQAGDIVEEAHNIVRIVGVDACPGLLILGKKNLYLVDGLVQTSNGEVIDAKDAPRDVLTIPGTLVDLAGSDQESHRWAYNEIVENNKRAFLFRDVALELYFSDKRNFLVVFKDKRERQGVVSKLTQKSDQSGGISKSVIGNFVLDQVARAMDRTEQQLEAMTRKWQNREISNFAYLQLLNQHANRTPNDVTQYPVFPWVLSDYTSDVLDLTKASSFRDLTLPMGALTPARREAAMERFSATEAVGEKPFHYGTHYSSSMIVCGFMIRMSPFTEIFLALQGGNFDLADRLFSSIPRAWESASADNRGDVRELVPEFFYSPAFLLNINRHDFGRKQVTGELVNDVALPPWALDDPSLFIHRHREALESDIVSRQLPAWIDLTFGYKQREPSAYNCFHPLSYRGGVDLENIEDEGEKAASTAIIHNFGQTPLQIFRTPHPHKFLSGIPSLSLNVRFGVAEQWQLLTRSILPISETTSPIHDVIESNVPEIKPSCQQKYRLVVPGKLLSVQYGFVDQSLRVYYQETGASVARAVLLVEGISVSHAVFASPTLLITASEQGVITAWRLSVKSGGYRKGDVTLTREGTLRGHDRPVTSLAASFGWSFLISGSEDGSVMVWDMNRLRYIRTMIAPHGEPIIHSAINEADGQIAVASRNHLYLFSLNGHPIANTAADLGSLPSFSFGLPTTPMFDDTKDEFTGGISFLKRDFLKFGVLFVIGIGSEIALFRCVPGVKSADSDDTPSWHLSEQGRLSRSDDHKGGDCCMVKFVGETLYAGFEPAEGSNKYLLYQWSLPEGGARNVPESISHTCMAEQCGRHFGLLEPKRYCGGCGGVFCGSHCVLVENFTCRYCEACRSLLAEASALGILKHRRDSATIGNGSRRNSIMPGSAPASRRGSIAPASGLPQTLRDRSVSRARSRPTSRSGSRTSSRTASRRPSVSLHPSSAARSREGTPA